MKLILLLSLPLVLAGCNLALKPLGLLKEIEEEATEPTNFKMVNEINFDSLKLGALKSCADCHDSGSFNANSESSVLQNKADIEQAITSNSMPPQNKGYQRLTDCEKEALKWWLNATASEKKQYGDFASCTSQSAETTEEAPQPEETPMPVPAPRQESSENPTPSSPAELWTEGELSFVSLKANLLEAKCLMCHSKEKARETVLERYIDFQVGGLLQMPLESNYLYKLVLPGEEKRIMPPRKSDIPPLTEKEIDYIKRWLEAGAPESVAAE